LSNKSTEKILFITAPVNALVEGLYQENTSIEELLNRGNFGLGTFDDLDGEMIINDGQAYQLKSDGKAYKVNPKQKTPYACVTQFEPYSFEYLYSSIELSELYAFLDRTLPSKNMVYALKIEGAFAHVRTRSVPKQDSYKPLVEVARNQPEFSFQDIEGSLIGFWTPEFLDKITVPGYHLHFLTSDQGRGGHLLDCVTKEIKISIQHVSRIELALPITLDYLTTNLNRDISSDLIEAESLKK